MKEKKDAALWSIKDVSYNNVYLSLLAASILVLPFSFHFSLYFTYAASFLWLLKVKEHFRNFDRELLMPFLIFSSLYVIQWVGLIHTENFSWGMSRTETKLSLLIFPILVLISSIGEREIHILKWAFVVSSTAACLWCHVFLVKAVIVDQVSWLDVMTRYDFRTTYFVLPLKMHPTYLTIFVAFSFFLLIELLRSKEAVTRNLILGVVLVYYTLVCYQAVSRAGILIFFITLSGLVLYSIFTSRQHQWVLWFFLVGIVVFIVGVFSNEIIYSKFLGEFKLLGETDFSADGGSVSQHLKSWYCAVELIWSDHFIFGYGTGDEKDALATCYASHHWEQMARQRNDAHNEFLSSGVRHGIIGIAQLIFFFVYIFRQALRTRDKIYLVFIVMFFLVSFAESTLKARTGVIFFSLFNALLFKASYIRSNVTRENSDRGDFTSPS